MKKLQLWVPRLIPNDSLYNSFVSNILKGSNWHYLREIFEVLANTKKSGFFQISASVDNVYLVFVYFRSSDRAANGFGQNE